MAENLAILSTVVADTEDCSALCSHMGTEHGLLLKYNCLKIFVLLK